jgi:hypothetical protein
LEFFPEFPARLQTKQASFSNFILLIFIAILIAGFVWFNYEVASLGLGGQDFYVQWASGRRLAYQAQDPYLDEEELPPLENFGLSITGTENLPFNTPVYSLFLIFPFLLIDDYQLAFVLWLVLSSVIMLASIRGCVTLTGWRPKQPLASMLFLFIAFGLYTVQALTSGSMIILVCGLLIMAFLALQSDKRELAGILFALTTVQPHFFLPLYALLIIWGLSKRKWNFVVWFLFGIVSLTIIGMFVLPDWPISYLRVWFRSGLGTTLATPGGLLFDYLPGFGRQLGWGLTIAMLLVCLAEWRNVRGKDFRWFFWTACLTLVASQWVGLPVNPSTAYILNIPVLLIVSIWAQRTDKTGLKLIEASLIVLLLLPWGIDLRAGVPVALTNHDPSHYFVLPFILLIGVFWVRWWAIRPSRLFIEELRSSEKG